MCAFERIWMAGFVNMGLHFSLVDLRIYLDTF